MKFDVPFKVTMRCQCERVAHGSMPRWGSYAPCVCGCVCEGGCQDSIWRHKCAIISTLYATIHTAVSRHTDTHRNGPAIWLVFGILILKLGYFFCIIYFINFQFTVQTFHGNACPSVAWTMRFWSDVDSLVNSFVLMRSNEYKRCGWWFWGERTASSLEKLIAQLNYLLFCDDSFVGNAMLRLGWMDG